MLELYSQKGFSVFDERAEDDWNSPSSYYDRVVESRRGYHYVPNRGAELSKIGSLLCEIVLSPKLHDQDIALSEPDVFCVTAQKAIQKLDLLLSDNADDFDDEFLKPTDEVLLKMEEFIYLIFGKFDERLSLPSFSPDGQGGLEATWHENGRYLQLIIPAEGNKPPYLFQKQGDKFGLVNFSEKYELIPWFTWLLQNPNSQT